jgi:hypothetical protein
MHSIKTNSIEPSPSWEAASRSAIQEFPNILWNPNVHYRVHKSLVPILSQIHPVHTTPSYFFKVNFNIIPHVGQDTPRGLFPYDFPAKTL